ncbi:MAG: YncE family protein [Nitrosarchaeum sp.]|nr:YncE family protein [Nitrosarchaeum sp.]
MPYRNIVFIITLGIFGVTLGSVVNAYSLQDNVLVGNYPRSIDIDPYLNNLYVANYDSGTVSVIDSKNMIIKDTIFINNGNSHPTKIGVDSKRHLIFVSDKISGKLTVINGINNEIINSQKIGQSLWDLQINDNNEKIYVSDLATNNVLIVDSSSLGIIKSVPLNTSPWAITIDHKTNKVYVASGDSQEINILDGVTNDLTDKINLGVKPWGISINENTGVMYVASWDSNKITMIDISDNKIIYEIPVISGAWLMSTNQNNGVTIISNEHTNELYLLSDDYTQYKSISVQDSPQSIVVDPLSNTVFTANPLSNSVSSIIYDSGNFKNTVLPGDILDANSIDNNMVLDVLNGILKTPDNQNVDDDLISGLLKNVGITGEFDGNEIANLLIGDYNKKIQMQPKTAQVPGWTTELVTMFGNDKGYQVPESINCDDASFSSIHDIDNVNAYDIWLKILPICALS